MPTMVTSSPQAEVATAAIGQDDSADVKAPLFGFQLNPSVQNYAWGIYGADSLVAQAAFADDLKKIDASKPY